MIVITDITYIKTPKELAFNWVEPTKKSAVTALNEPLKMSVSETIYGKKFHTVIQGIEQEYIIGMTKNVAEILGLPFYCIEDLTEQNAELSKKLQSYKFENAAFFTELLDLRLKVKQLSTATLWDKLIWAFTGKLKV